MSGTTVKSFVRFCVYLFYNLTTEQHSDFEKGKIVFKSGIFHFKHSLCHQDPSGYTRLPLEEANYLTTIDVTHSGGIQKCQLNLTEHKAYSLIIYGGITCQQASCHANSMSSEIWK